MTDNEIIKALERCGVKEANCKYCVFRFQEMCRVFLAKEALDLITRQKVEIGRLKNAGDNKTKELLRHNIFIEELQEKLKTAKAEAIKEFAERLDETKFKQGNEYIIYADNVSVIKKEMVGDNDE